MQLAGNAAFRIEFSRVFAFPFLPESPVEHNVRSCLNYLNGFVKQVLFELFNIFVVLFTGVLPEERECDLIDG